MKITSNSTYVFVVMLFTAFSSFLFSQNVYDFEQTIDGWVVETDSSSMGAVSVEQSKLFKYTGEKSLKVACNMQKADTTKTKGEIRVDLEVDPPNNSIQAPINLLNRTVIAYVRFPKEFQGESHSPNGMQVFAKTIIEDTTDQGDDKWPGLYSKWINATGKQENWIKITLTVKDNKLKGQHRDNGFDPTNVSIIGIKFALGDKASMNCKFKGDIFVDHVTWE